MFEGKSQLKARALLVGERLDLKALENADALAEGPLLIAAGVDGAAALFRYGAVVFFGVSPVEEVSFLAHLKPLVRDEFETPESEEAVLELVSDGDRLEKGIVKLRQFDAPRLQIVADVLAKSVVLAHYESSTDATFESIEPFAQSLRAKGAVKRADRELLTTIGDMLLIEHRTVGIAQVGDKPEILWEKPELERLYSRLEDEYEVSERQAALGRKLEVISRTAETVLNLLQHQSGLRVEWSIVALIVFEIAILLWDMFGRG
ncbi:MAG TPA: RMD1 family protein [Abditibacterium sp.]|jgi:uncharacterized Rmd1/YagE family protein